MWGEHESDMSTKSEARAEQQQRERSKNASKNAAGPHDSDSDSDSGPEQWTASRALARPFVEMESNEHTARSNGTECSSGPTVSHRCGATPSLRTLRASAL